MGFDLFFLVFLVLFRPGVVSLRNYSSDTPVHYNVAAEIFKRYDPGFLPKRLTDPPIVVNFSLELYQIIEVNEPQQFLMINAWTVERWVDNLLGWNPEDHMNLSEILVPHEKLFVPDTTLYNSLVMDEQHTKKLLNAKLITRGRNKGALIELLYPTIFKSSCNLDLRFFPFDLQANFALLFLQIVQKCDLIFGSWTFDATLLDYVPHNPIDGIGIGNCIENEGWEVIGTTVERNVKIYECCPNPYTTLKFHIYVQRKPLYYIISLIIPTSIITFISIVGFFSSPSINDLREEKISLGITTLLSMSILVFMVSDRIPSTSSFILIGWFYTSMILLISFGTLASSVVIYIQKKGLFFSSYELESLGIIGNFPDQKIMKWAQIIAKIEFLEMPLLMRQAYARKAYEEKQKKAQQSKNRRNLWYKLIDAAKEQKKSEIEELDKKTSISSYYTNATKMFEKSPCDLSQARDSIDSQELHSPSSLRSLAQLEYDWLAAVIERIFLISFIILFIFFSFGTLGIGFYKWKRASIDDFKK